MVLSERGIIDNECENCEKSFECNIHRDVMLLSYSICNLLRFHNKRYGGRLDKISFRMDCGNYKSFVEEEN